jgi:aldehyde dehydrogenase (NAD+)
VEHPDIGVISFTGSTEVGRYIAETAGKRLARISLELGGKNPLVVCDDANLENAVKWVILSAFSNAGQRCAAASRIIIFNSVYDKFTRLLIEKTEQLNIGTADSDDLGPVINETQLKMMINSVEQASRKGARILTGGTRLSGTKYVNGFFMTPTIIDNIGPSEDISKKELFGPIICLYRVNNFEEAVSLANNTHYGLTACIHSRNIHRAIEFTQRIQTGVAVINAGTYGSEPHMPFGGMKQSGNGTREPGTEALDVYSELRDVYIMVDEKEF